MKNIINYKLIENFMNENNLSKTAFCKLCGISYGVLKKIMLNDKRFSLLAFYKISKTLKVKMADLINRN